MGLRVHGAKRLRVVDASVFPLEPSAKYPGRGVRSCRARGGLDQGRLVCPRQKVSELQLELGLEW